jgi:hypothetical protein
MKHEVAAGSCVRQPTVPLNIVSEMETDRFQLDSRFGAD